MLIITFLLVTFPSGFFFGKYVYTGSCFGLSCVLPRGFHNCDSMQRCVLHTIHGNKCRHRWMGHAQTQCINVVTHCSGGCRISSEDRGPSRKAGGLQRIILANFPRKLQWKRTNLDPEGSRMTPPWMPLCIGQKISLYRRCWHLSSFNIALHMGSLPPKFCGRH